MTRWFRITESAFQTEHFLKDDEVKTVIVNERRVCLARYKGVYYAVSDRCPHAGASLGKGWCEKGAVVCPLHRISFSLLDGSNPTGEGYRNETYPVRIQDDYIEVGFADKPAWYKFW